MVTLWYLLIPYVTSKYLKHSLNILKHQRNSQNMPGSPDLKTHQDPKPRYDAAIFSCKGTWEHPWSQWRTALRNLADESWWSWNLQELILNMLSFYVLKFWHVMTCYAFPDVAQLIDDYWRQQSLNTGARRAIANLATRQHSVGRWGALWFLIPEQDVSPLYFLMTIIIHVYSCHFMSGAATWGILEEAHMKHLRCNPFMLQGTLRACQSNHEWRPSMALLRACLGNSIEAHENQYAAALGAGLRSSLYN